MTNIVLNEKEYTEGLLERSGMGTKPTETICRLIRYYFDLGYGKAEVRRKVEEFMTKSDPMINLVKWDNILEHLVKSMQGKPLITLEAVPITEFELEVIETLASKSLKKLLFTIIALSKYEMLRTDAAKSQVWVNRTDQEIFSLANITVTQKRQSLMLNDLKQSGFIRFSRIVDNISIKVQIDENDSKTALKISDFRNLGYQFLHLSGGAYFYCLVCGVIQIRRTNNQKYCRLCAKEMNRIKTVERWKQEIRTYQV